MRCRNWKKKPNLELRKAGQHETKKLERKERRKVNEQKLKHELSDANNKQTKFKMDVQQQLHTVQQKQKDDHHRLSKNKGQLKIAPKKEACNARPMDMTALNQIHHIKEEPITQSYNRNMHKSDQKQRPRKEKAWNTRLMDMTTPNEIHHIKEQPTTQSYNANMNKNDQKQGPRKEKAWNTRPLDTKGLNDLYHHKEQPTTQDTVTNTHNEDQEQGHREVKVWDTRPRNMKRLNEIHHIGEQPTTLLHNTNVHRLINENHNLKKEKEDLHKKIEEQFKQIELLEVQKEVETVKRLRHEGQVCDMNCVSLAMLWIGKHILKSINVFCCASQFEKLITLYAFGNQRLETENLRCGYFMKILRDVNMVGKNVYEYKMNKQLVIRNVWETLMKMNERVCILAKWNAQSVGHVVVCDLETRTSKTKDGKVMFHDPRALPSSGRRIAEMSLQKFIEYVNYDVGLMLYTVNLAELNRIMLYYKDVLHITELPHSCANIT